MYTLSDCGLPRLGWLDVTYLGFPEGLPINQPHLWPELSEQSPDRTRRCNKSREYLIRNGASRNVEKLYRLIATYSVYLCNE